MNYKEKYNDWLNNKNISKEIKQILNDMDEDEIREAFSNDLEFNTAGARGIMGIGSGYLNEFTIRKINYGLYNYFSKYYLGYLDKGIVIGYDNRNNSKEFANMCAAFFTSRGIKVYMSLDLMPTPLVSHTILNKNLLGGINITASHNPKEYNGYKVYNSYGYQFSLSEANLLIDEMSKISIDLMFEKEEEINHENLIILKEEFANSYFEKIKTSRLNPSLDKEDFKIVYTPLHGSGLKGVRHVLEMSGYNLSVVKEQSTYDKEFVNTSSLNPEDLNAYDMAINLAKSIDADIVLATDPDADRIGVCIRKEGDYHLLNGNEIGSLLTYYLLTNKKDLKDGKIITTIVTSTLGERIADDFNVETIYTLTGFKFIGELISKNKFKNFILGYEESNGYLVNKLARDKDAISASLMISEMALFFKLKGLDLIDVLESLYERYGYHLNLTKAYTFKGNNDLIKMNQIITKLRNLDIHEIGGYKVVFKEDYLTSRRYSKEDYKPLDLPISNVLKLIFEDKSYIAIRPSGTEPKLKVYYNIIEDNKKKASSKLEAFKSYIDKALNN